ncbi:hypothetical protein BGW36DRAFT_401859 [Talaromyces proteolyticus]|uniref:RING-type domain-containing protein n=1 Tax=Talaromyces proteolyticus TaxID=1131652 RepID=A0AAD4KHG3_9EURO|nr:uncharacterized protein BGW36DRAFT_401859 [Talaromyces proteolyticus]KAH8689514.1 hypothetical protein BGW36DRAFT_401859 [Talaromyces proteolyticus]
MSNRNQIDSVIDDDEETCPLCIEEFDLSDKNFRPCPCGYQICQFCYNNIKTHNEEGRCPNCRRVYDESTIQYKVPDADEFKADLALKHRKAAAAKKKEVEKREIEASSRKNLDGVRVVQKNLVYVIGLNPTIRDEGQLLQTLRGPDYFGQYGEIDKIVVSKAKPGGNPNQGIGVYVTFARKIDAATCIAAVDGSQNGDRLLRAQYGTTKYCSSFLRNEQCNNRNCTFLHETGEDSESYSRQDLSSMNTAQRHGYHTGAAVGSRPFAQNLQSHQMRRQTSKDDVSKQILDGPALPSSASWANKDTPINRARRVSASGSRSSPSPIPTNVTILAKSEESKKQTGSGFDSRRSTPAPQTQPAAQPTQSQAQEPPSKDVVLDSLLKAVNSPDFRFVFSTEGLSSEDIKYIENGPSFIDPYGGVKRRAMREKAEQERAKQEVEAQSLLQSTVPDEEARESGSLQLGGEPDDAHPPRGTGTHSRENHGAIQPPSQQGTADNSTVGSPLSLSQQFHNLNMNTRSLTPLQQQQLMLLKSSNDQQVGVIDHLGSAFDQGPQSRQGLFQGTMPQGGNVSTSRTLGQQAPLTPNPLGTPAPQQNVSNQFYTSSVQGPPPGLKTAGTPPISGGGMFAQGHGFTSNTSLGLGTNVGKQEASPDLMRELLRGRSGTGGTGGVQGHEAAKPGIFADSGPQKQKKKGKKHRHANTSSGGGGVVDLADPSILQARMHQAGVGTTGQVLYGSQGQVDDDEFPPLSASTKEKTEFPFRPFLPRDPPDLSTRSGTPTLPPGLPLPQGHPAAALFLGESTPQSPASSINLPTHPPGLPSSRHGTPFQKSLDSISRRQTPMVRDASDENSSEKTRNFGDISFGSPKERSSKKTSVITNEDRTAVDTDEVSHNDSVKEMQKRTKPVKLDLSIPSTESIPPSPVKDMVSSIVGAPGVLSHSAAGGSRPGTPMTGLSRNSDSSGSRQPRVLRVVDTPKTETPPPVSASQVAPTLPSMAQTRVLSRQPSLSSSGRPTTPADFGSDYEQTTSASVSRADSPPPRIGTAPVRAMTKNQAKKERRLKAKQAEEALKEETATTTTEETVQAPIIGRKRKTKKTPTTSSEQSIPATTVDPPKNDIQGIEVSAVHVDDVKSHVDRENTKNKEEDTPRSGRQAPITTNIHKPVPEHWRAKNTISQLFEDVEASGVSLKDLYQERSLPLHLLLAQLHEDGVIDLNTHPLFNPPPLNQRTDMKCTAEDYFRLQESVELAKEDLFKAVKEVKPIRINNGFKDLKDRCIITPNGRVLRHLSAEEEDRVLELERRVDIFTCREEPPLYLGERDRWDASCGLNILCEHPEKFKVRWLNETPSLPTPPPVVTNEDRPPAESGSGRQPITIKPAAELETSRPRNTHKADAANVSTHDSETESVVRPATIDPDKQALETGRVAFGEIGEIDNIPALNTTELREYITQSQKEYELSRKDFEAIDKKFNALIKRNKKLVQQALGAAIEVGK